jgi:hypothetical protein
MPGDSGEASRNGSGRACPFGKCDGSGWILGDDDLAYECECLAPRLTRARSAGVNSVIPPRYRGVSFDRPPITEIDSVVVNAVRDWVENIDGNLERGRGIWLMGDTGTGRPTMPVPRPLPTPTSSNRSARSTSSTSRTSGPRSGPSGSSNSSTP